MKNQLQKWFGAFLVGMLLFMILFSFLGPKGKAIDLKEVSFSTQGSSRLFFKNMRSYFYDKEVRTDANYELYRINSREKDSTSNHLSFVLVHNWLMNECYIRAESRFDSLQIKWNLAPDSGSFELQGENSYQHFVFAAQLFEQLDREALLVLRTEEGDFNFSEEELSSLRTTLKDYFKLVGKLR